MADYFNAVERLEKFYGDIPEMEKAWIEDNIESLTDEQKGKFFKALTTAHEFKNGYPEISVMATVFKNVMNKAPKTYAWSICKECGCEYDYRLPCCPACYEKGLDCRAKAVKKSDFQPPMKVVRYNKPYMNADKGETICFNCVHKNQSFCKNYGNPNCTCRREEFESCNCARCCAVAKRYNAELEKNKNKNKISYAVPIKAVK